MIVHHRQHKASRSAFAEDTPEIAEPTLYHVVLLNDDTTPMDFVIMVLSRVFRLETEAAIKLMLEIHEVGRGIAGTYPEEIAESKLQHVQRLATEAGYPLRGKLEEAPPSASKKRSRHR